MHSCSIEGRYREWGSRDNLIGRTNYQSQLFPIFTILQRTCCTFANTNDCLFMNLRLGNPIMVISSLLLGIISCKKNSSLTPSHNIYIAYEDDSLNRAYLWNNGVSTPLTSASVYSRANSVFVSGNDVYVVGIENDIGNNTPSYWKNGVAYHLPDALSSYYTSIYVSGNDVYLAGSKSVNGNNVATYWKNGVAAILSLPTGYSFSIINSIFVAGSDVYVAGNLCNNTITGAPYVAAYWKNGALNVLSNPINSSNAASIYAYGADVYVAGFEYSVATYGNTVATYWKNGVPIHLTDSTISSSANSIFVSAGDVYVAGSYMNYSPVRSVATYWKNGFSANLEYSSDQSYANSIFVSGNDVYISGSVTTQTSYEIVSNSTLVSFYTVAAYWKNWDATLLTSDKSTPGPLFVK
jgi:hypothetical protein